MTKEELEKQLDELARETNTKIEELKAEIESYRKELRTKTPKCEIWQPKANMMYWYVDADSEINTVLTYQKPIIDNGNAYPTKEKAEFEANREKYTRLFRQYVEQHSEPLDWSDVRQEKWYVFYDWELKNICFNYICGEQGVEVYGSSEEVMREAVDFIGEENAIKYVLGVKSE